MNRLLGVRRLAVMVGIALLLAGCKASAPGASGGSPGPSAEDAQLPALHLSNVETDASRARGARIGGDGGSITAVGSDGTTYVLTLPAGAVVHPTQVSIYPVSKLGTGLGDGGRLIAGVQFEPEGLLLRAPGTLTITLAAGADPSHLSGIGWRGDAEGVHGAPAIVNGRTVTLAVLHFSGGGVTNVPLVPLACAPSTDPTCEINRFETMVSFDLTQTNARELLTTDIKAFYRDVVEEAWISSLEELTAAPSTPPKPLDEDMFAQPYQVFLRTIAIAQILLDDPTFTVAPEADEGRTAAATFIRGWYDADNAQCRAHAGDSDDHDALAWAILGIDDATSWADAWDLSSAANKLDYETLLNDECVQVVIDPSRSYSATGPGTSGTLKVEVEYSIAGGPLLVRDGTHLIHVLVTYTGDSLPLLDKDADSSPKLEAADIRWPDGVDPVRFDFHATMVQIIDGATVPTKLARFDRLTKATGARLVYSVLGTNEAHIVVVDKHGATTIADNADQPQWSPDGSRIAYYSQAAGQIFTMAPDGTDKQQVTSGAAHAVDPAWSPDGKQIAYLLSPAIAGSKPTIAIAEADGSSTRNTGVQAVSGKLSWSPDGQRIAFVNINPDALAVGRASLTLFVMDVAGGGSAKLIGQDCGGGAFWPDWSSTGSTIAFQCADAESTGHLWVATVSASGGGVHKLAIIDSERPIVPAWSPDGKILATGGFETGIRFIAVDPSGTAPTIATGGDVPFWVDWAP